MDDVSDEKFIDRKAEQELFRKMLRLDAPARVLFISDKGGRGKSHLLKRLEYICKWEEDIPCSRVELKELQNPSPLALIKKIRDDLKLELEEFDRLYTARVLRQHEEFGWGGG